MKILRIKHKFKNAILLVFLWLSIVSLQAQEITWKWQNPFPSGNSHFDVSWINDQTIYAPGTKGQFLKSSDFGATWETANISTLATVRAIHFANENEG